jgi:hypothetical protein
MTQLDITASTRATARRNDAAIMALRLTSPLRPLARSSAPVDGLALFDAVHSPLLL